MAKARVQTIDGSHIQCLFITFFYRFLRPIIEQGYLYLSCSPLYKLSKGKTVKYAYTDTERDTLIKEFNSTPDISRYKGMGEMDGDLLWDTTMDPNNRRLIQITIDDIEQDEEMLTLCMGEQVAPRREFIMANALNAKSLD